jgi:hypothetical protein
MTEAEDSFHKFRLLERLANRAMRQNLEVVARRKMGRKSAWIDPVWWLETD